MVIYGIIKVYHVLNDIIIEHVNAFNNLQQAKNFGYRCIHNYKLKDSNKIFYRTYFENFICTNNNVYTHCEEEEYYCPEFVNLEFENIVGIFSTTDSDIVYIITQSNQNTLISSL